MDTSTTFKGLKNLVGIFLLFFVLAVSAQPDTTAFPSTSMADSTQMVNSLDTASIQFYAALINDSLWWRGSGQEYQSDVQQVMNPQKSSLIIILLLAGLAAITYLKIAYGKDLEELFQSVLNKNIAQQIFRAQSGELTLSSMVLHLNFILVFALFLQFTLVERWHPNSFQDFSVTLFLIFLFTLFYVSKLLVLKLIGVIFEVKNETDEYIFHFTTICKTLGLTMFPALFVLNFTQKYLTGTGEIFSLIIFFAFFLLLLYRGLSTARKFLYRNIYHFIIYVCVVEISMMFLFFKLLTKTIT